MNDELKQLIEDAAKLLGLEKHLAEDMYMHEDEGTWRVFDPLDPERGDLMKVAMAAELAIDFSAGFVWSPDDDDGLPFTKGDYPSLSIAVLRAASAVWKARGGK